VKVCSAYGAGFFFIPGTDTCLKIGGRVRADYSFVTPKDQYSASGSAATSGTYGAPVVAGAVTAPGTYQQAGAAVVHTVLAPTVIPGEVISKITAGKASNSDPVISQAKDGQNALGWEARGSINFDARTATAWGTVQTAASIRLARTTGVVGVDAGASSASAGATLESAYVRFAGFTAGAARDNFAFMPSLTYGAGHWGSFANGAKQLAYTATFGGGVSATIALQDSLDTTAGAANATTGTGSSAVAPYYVYNSAPQVNANIRIDQSWGALQLMGAYADMSVNTAIDAYDYNKGVYAIGAGVKINLPMLAKGDALYLTAAYANGMTEYTTNWTSFKSSAYRRDVGGYTMNHPSVVATDTGLETVKSWGVAALFEHYWAPQYRSVVFGTYGQLDAPATAKANVWDGKKGFGDATVWNIGTNFAWLPTRGLEIGVEVIYARVNQDVRGFVAGTAAGLPGAAAPVTATAVSSRSDSNVTGRLRVERTF
jgi:hypothetical protein